MNVRGKAKKQKYCLEFNNLTDGGKQPLQRSTFYRRPGQDSRGNELMFKFTQHMVHQVLHLDKASIITIMNFKFQMFPVIFP